MISLINSCSNSNLDFLCLVGSFCSSGYDSLVEILSKFSIANIKLLKTLSLAINNNPKLLKKIFFNWFFILIQIL